MPPSTTKHAVMDNNDSSEIIDTLGRSDSSKTNDIEDKLGGDDNGQKSYGYVLWEWKSNKGTYKHMNSFVNEHTCDKNDNYNIDFKRVSACVIGDLFVSKFGDPRHRIHPKDIVSEMRKHHGIHLSYKKVYGSKKHTLSQIFSDSWESFQWLLAYLYVLEQLNPGTVTNIKTDSKNKSNGFMAI
ncbi:hypothetical protein Ddye_001639 [Dipteronia dyeriana]|uniref:Uncharacterized protein n=1 Tax=Dipteronia dyeriana TaxID=168575 RepID=A0AAD9XPM7_9ROSI|nr:hypothetical protein Ddye_001639 [Dipteronia dyeriana]